MELVLARVLFIAAGFRVGLMSVTIKNDKKHEVEFGAPNFNLMIQPTKENEKISKGSVVMLYKMMSVEESVTEKKLGENNQATLLCGAFMPYRVLSSSESADKIH